MKCPQCGMELADDAKFCGACGAAIEVQTTSEDTTETVNQTSETPDVTAPAQESETEVAPAQEPETEATPAQESETEAAPAQEPETEAAPAQEPETEAAPAQEPSDSGAFYNQNMHASNTASDKSSLMKLIGIGIVAVIVLIVLCKLLFGGGKTAPIKDMVRLYNSHSTNYEKICKANYGDVWGEFKYEQEKRIAEASENEDWEEDIEDNMNDLFDDFDDEFGDDWKIDYEVTREKELKKSELENYEDIWDSRIDSIDNAIDALEYSDYSDSDIDDLTDFYEDWLEKLDDIEITEGYRLKVKLTIEGDDDSSRNTREIVVLKIDGDWVPMSTLF